MRQNSSKYIVAGLQLALKAFIISIIFSAVLSLVINYAFAEGFSEIMSGNIGTSSVTFTSIIRLTFIIFNLSLFNVAGSMKVGLVILGIIPLVAFGIVSRGSGLKKRLIDGLIECTIASIVFALLQLIVSLITSGDLVDGMFINFATIRNILSTVIITLLIQVFIRVNYRNNYNQNSGLKAFSITFKSLLSISTFIGIIASIVLLKDMINEFILLVFSIILLLPNIVVYLILYMMGLTIKMSEPLHKALNVAGVDVSIVDQFLLFRFLGVAIFIGIIIFSIFKIRKNLSLKSLVIYMLLLSVFSGLIAYCSMTNLGKFIFVGEVIFGISPVLAVIVPLVGVFVIGIIYNLIDKLINIVQQ